MRCMMVNEKEIKNRLKRFRENMCSLYPEWELCAVFHKINIFYFTGTMQNGVLIIPREGESSFFVRKSYERAVEESKFENIYPIKSFRDIKSYIKINSKDIFIEKEKVPFAHFERFNKHFGFGNIKGMDIALLKTRSVKSDFEVEKIKNAGAVHYKTLEEKAPEFLFPGISEAEFGAELLSEMIKLGHEGITRIGAFNSELYLGNISFGDSGNHYNSFDGPAGVRGFSPAVPLFGSFEKKFSKNGIGLVDTGCCHCGYYTDKTTIYSSGILPEYIYDFHQKCVDIQNKTAELLIPGKKIGDVYNEVMRGIPDDFLENFMGYQENKVRFLGHGIGLVIDEYPPITGGIDEVIQENMVFAIEPKKSIPGFGMVGIENTFLITDNGGISLTGMDDKIISVD